MQPRRFSEKIKYYEFSKISASGKVIKIILSIISIEFRADEPWTIAYVGKFSKLEIFIFSN